MVARNSSNEISITRLYDAPLAVVWEAWTDPVQAAQWWGPRGFTLTTHHKDLRPGGIWHYTMHGPDGTDYPNKTLYHVVEPLQKLVYDHGANDDRPPMFRVTVLFSESDGKTKMEMTMALPTAEQAEATRKFVKAAGGNATWDRLAEYLDEVTMHKTIFVINRSFDEPMEQVVAMWVHPDKQDKWLSEAHGQIEYRERAIPDHLVMVQRSVQAEGGSDMSASQRQDLLTSIRFFPEGENATRVTLVSKPLEESSAEVVQALANTRTHMTKQWSDSFDRLEALFGS